MPVLAREKAKEPAVLTGAFWTQLGDTGAQGKAQCLSVTLQMTKGILGGDGQLADVFHLPKHMSKPQMITSSVCRHETSSFHGK